LYRGGVGNVKIWLREQLGPASIEEGRKERKGKKERKERRK
jgi:hypothetical protein